MKATSQGRAIVKLRSPRQVRAISGPRNRIESAIAALSGSIAGWANPSVATASVMLCATVNEVMVLISVQRSPTISNSPSTNTRWSAPNQMCWMP